MSPDTIPATPSPVPSFLINPHPKHVFRDAIGKLPMNGVHTICEEAKCPNRGECLPHHGTISIMVMGSICTRGCPFCAVTTGKPLPLDPDEPAKVVEIARTLDVRYLVMTSPNRDELPDGGAGQFTRIVRALRDFNPALKIEILVPDFQGKESSYAVLLQDPPDTIAHDLQTIPRLYGPIRPGADYGRSLGLFRWFRGSAGGAKVMLKAGLMVGFGETEEEVLQVLRDAKDAGVKFFTIGQYLKPPGSTLEVAEYVPLDRYRRWTEEGARMGLAVQASPLTRSSYLADRLAGGR
ncbi:MAG TPA: lipoyl synthase [bacterium]|nr:lipoyl synthase [bacterium]